MIWAFVLIFLIFLVWLVSMSTYQSDLRIHVNAPLPYSFTITMDESMMGEWLGSDQMQFKSIENIQGGPKEIGSQWKLVYETKGREIEMIETVTDYVENKRFAFDIEDTFARFQITMDFHADDNGTVMTEHTKGAGKSLAARAMLLFFAKSAEKTKRKMYEKLKNLIEARYNRHAAEQEE